MAWAEAVVAAISHTNGAPTAMIAFMKPA
jgi:hypothetical protein